MFGIVLLTAITAMQGYVFWRAGSLPLFGRRLPRRAMFGSGVLLWALFVAGRWLRHSEAGTFGAALERFAMNWLGVVFLCALCLLAVELGTGFGFLVRRGTPRLRGLGLLAGAILSTVALVQGTRLPVVESHEVTLPGLPRALDGTVLVAISDTHLGAVLGGEWLERLAERIHAEDPDLLVLVGDVFEGHGVDSKSLGPALRRLRARLGVFAVPGNHDFHGGSGGDLPLLVEAGHQVLRNRWVEVSPGLALVGADDLTRARRHGGRDDLIARALAGRPEGAAILLSHTPWSAERAAAAGAGLMLSGHTHAGQIWPFGHLVALRYPLVDGRYSVDGMTVLVSRGAGTWGPRMRLWSPGQILRITLRAPTAG